MSSNLQGVGDGHSVFYAFVGPTILFSSALLWIADGGRLSKLDVPYLFETKLLSSRSFSYAKLPISESESLKELSNTSSVLYFIPLEMILVILVPRKSS